MRKIELKVCADCGGKAETGISDYIYIHCSRCDALVDIPHLSYEGAYFHWNMTQEQKEKRES